jgi:hypothetical protein
MMTYCVARIYLSKSFNFISKENIFHPTLFFSVELPNTKPTKKEKRKKKKEE